MGMVVCWSTCWPCQMGACEQMEGPHTWMDAEDIEHLGMTVPDSADAWDKLAALSPCGCYCNEEYRHGAT